MNEVINREIARIKEQAANKAIKKVRNATLARIDQISMVLDSEEGMNIFRQTYGSRFDRHYELRRILRSRMDELFKVFEWCQKAEAETLQELTNDL